MYIQIFMECRLYICMTSFRVAQSVKNLQVEGTASIQEWHDSFSGSLKVGRARPQGKKGRAVGHDLESFRWAQYEAGTCAGEEGWMRTEELEKDRAS